MGRPKNPEKQVNRSFRFSEEAWKTADARAKSEGISLNHAVGDLIYGYGQGIYNLPTHRVIREFPPQPENGPTTVISARN